MSQLPAYTSLLLAGNSQYGALAALRGLRAAGYEPWLAIDEPGTYVGRSRAAAGTIFVPNPALDSEEFTRELAAAAARLSVAAVLPSTENHLLALADREADFSGIALGVPSCESVDRATDKELLPELAKIAGLQTPPTKKVVRDESEALDAFGFPAILKPLRSRIRNPEDGTIMTCSASYVSSRQAGEEALEALPHGEGLLQPYTPGTLCSVSGVSWKGDLVCALHHTVIRIWPPYAGLTAYAETVAPDAELERGVGRLLQALGWSGLFQIEFIRSPNGERFLIDLNPRIYLSLALPIAAGLNLPGIWADLLLGRRPSVGGYRIGTRFRQEEKDVRALAWMLVNGKPQDALRGLMPKRNTTHAISSLHDPMPLFTSAVKLAGRFRR